MSTETITPSHSAINPLIDENGDTGNVSAALDFVAWAITEGSDDEGRVALTSGQAFGLVVVINACSAALKDMQ
jgi:hypothetical protein